MEGGFDPSPHDHPDVEVRLREICDPIITGARRMSKPVLAASTGRRPGSASLLALACDVVVARESAYLLLREHRALGGRLVAAGPGARWVRAGGRHGAAGRADPGAPGARMRLVNRVVADDESSAAVDALAERLAAGPIASYAGSKCELNAWLFSRIDVMGASSRQTCRRGCAGSRRS